MDAVRRRTTVSLPAYMLADLGAEARRLGISVSRLLEHITEERMYGHPNAETLAALEECRSGADLPAVDTSSVEAMTKSILG